MAQLCPIRFQGQWEDAESGLYYNRFRYYEPLAGQYASPDPIGLLVVPEIRATLSFPLGLWMLRGCLVAAGQASPRSIFIAVFTRGIQNIIMR